MTEEFLKIIQGKNNILILCHIRPDGDTIGSAYALKYGLEKLDKNVCVVCSHPITEKYQFISKTKETYCDFEAEVFITVDVASVSLLGEKYAHLADKIDICIDHHKSNSHYAKLNIIDTKSAATGEVVYTLLKKLNIEMDSEIATCLYTAISTDTGCFKFANTTSKTFEIVSKIVNYIPNLEELNRRLFEMKSIREIKLESIVYATMKFYADNRIALAYIPMDTVKQLNATEDDIDGMSALPRRIEGVMIGICAREIKKGEFKFSVRSNGNIDVSLICQKFSGGGHFNASGCTIFDSKENAIAKMLKECEAALGAV